MIDKLSLKVTQASLNQTAEDWAQNAANHYAAIDIAAAEGSDHLSTQELGLNGYEVGDYFQKTDNEKTYRLLQNMATYMQAVAPDMTATVGTTWRVQLREAFHNASGVNPEFEDNCFYDTFSRPFNVQVLIGGGRILGMTAKQKLFGDERGDEFRYFNQHSSRHATEYAQLAGIESNFGTIPIALPDGQVIPFGRPLIYMRDKEGRGLIHATAICEEKWRATKYAPSTNTDEHYGQLNVIPSIKAYLGTKKGVVLDIANASPPSREKQDKHMHLNELASQYVDVVIDTDGLGTSGAALTQFGHRLIAQDGKTISAGARMKFGQLATTTSIVQINNADPALENLTHGTLVKEFKIPNAVPKTELVWKTDSKQAWDDPKNPDRWKEERIRNQALWMFDYMKKTGARGIMEALSGGKDSSFNCAMVRVMVELTMNDLGVDGFCEEMAHLPYIDKIMAAYEEDGYEAAVEACMDDMLTAVYMGTNNSSYETWYASKTLMEGAEFSDGSGHFKGIGGKFVERNVQDLLNFYNYAFAISDTTKIPNDKKLEVMNELADFLNASPYEHTPEEMKKWQKDIFEKYPEVEQLVSAAIPGHGIAYENIQARGREVLIMLFANIEGKMPVANPNLDEAYGAYATFGGDLHSGTVNWNGGLHKEDQVSLMEYLEEKGIPGVMERIISLGPANDNEPSAELQPKQDGKVTQNDEDALQGTFPQKAALARLKHHTKILTDNGERWMNAGELYEYAREDVLFSELNDSDLFNAVGHFYLRWEGPAQHKVHATPITPTFGENVDKQMSLRKPNLGGGARDEIVAMGINLIIKWAKEDGLDWAEDEQFHEVLYDRALQDKPFINEFYNGARNRDPNIENKTFNLHKFYARIRDNSWDEVITPLAAHHPIAVVAQHRALEMS